LGVRDSEPASLPASGATHERAAGALYEAKRAGKNRTCTA
jgi:PleD family two-component response regulator